jgi:hypothetical protein
MRVEEKRNQRPFGITRTMLSGVSAPHREKAKTETKA